MNAKTELLLYHLMWSAESMLRPTFRSLSGSFESWAYQNGFLQRIHALEKANLIARNKGNKRLDRVYKLTQDGLVRAMGGRHPEQEWARKWDGQWRFILFDLPESQRTLRAQLRTVMRNAHFGCLQKSVWISPDPIAHLRDKMKLMNIDASTLSLIEGHPCGGEATSDIISSAWPFDAINRCYKMLEEHLKQLPAARSPRLPARLKQWTETECALWGRCMRLDPLLPEDILPRHYRGQKTWKLRLKTMRDAGKLMRSLSLS